jgi:hypothetical protein
MTSFSFILGVTPLAVATGAGAEMRQSLGTAVLFAMSGVTRFGLLFTPTFYTCIRKLGPKKHAIERISDVSCLRHGSQEIAFATLLQQLDKRHSVIGHRVLGGRSVGLAIPP